MTDVINFVRDQRKKLTKQQVQDRLFFKYATIACVVSFVIFVAAVGARLVLSLQVKQILDQQDDQRAVIQAREDDETAYLLFAAKLDSLSTLFINRKNKQEAINYFSTLFGEDVLVNNIRYDAENGALKFGLTTRNVFSLNQVIDTLSAQSVRDRFKQLKFDDLTRADNGEYQTNITVVLKT